MLLSRRRCCVSESTFFRLLGRASRLHSRFRSLAKRDEHYAEEVRRDPYLVFDLRFLHAWEVVRADLRLVASRQQTLLQQINVVKNRLHREPPP